MSKSPAMLNKAKRIGYKQLVCHFKNKEYSTFIPTKPEINVKSFLEAFSESNFEGDFQYHDIEMYKGNEYLPYEHILHEDNFEPTYKLHFSELNKKNFLENAHLDQSTPWYEIFGLDARGYPSTDSKNFFEYLIEEFPEFTVSDKDFKKNLEISNLVNTEAAKSAQEENSKQFSNQWLYNSNSVSLITPLNIQSWDMFYYKNLLTQMLSQFVRTNNSSLLDVDFNARGLHTKETNSDFLLKSKNSSFKIPITVVENINEVEIFDKLRTTLYDYYFPKLYPMFAYEFVDPNDHDAETILKANFVNKKMFTDFNDMYRININEKFDENSFKNFDTLKVLSKTREAMTRRVHIGISTFNDVVRFNLYMRPLHRQMENKLSLCCSPSFKLDIKPGESRINNEQDFKAVLDILNILTNINPNLLDALYCSYLNNSEQIRSQKL